ncbi:MAG: tetratricopeptide repeat protein, partial [Cyanophyceae cyanobacterium]
FFLVLMEFVICSFEFSLVLYSYVAFAYNNRGYALSDLGQKEDAIASYEKAIELDSKNSSLHGNLGWLYLECDRLDLAKHHTTKALKLKPDQGWLIFNLGLICALDNNLPEAIQHWKQGIEIHTNLLFTHFDTIVIGEQETGLEQLQHTLNNSESTIDDIESILDDAEVLTRCPTPIPGLPEAIALLKTALEARQPKGSP